MAPPMHAMDVRSWSLLVSLSILWGGAFFFAGVAVRELPPLTVVLCRVLIAALTLLPLFYYFGHSLPRSYSGWLPFLGMGLFNNVLPFGFIFFGQTYISVGLSSIINAMTPLFAVIVMAAFNEERLTVNRVIGVVLGVIGVAILRGIDSSLFSAANSHQTFGILLCLAGAFSYGIAALWGRRYLSGVPPLKSATCQLLCSTLIIAVAASLVDQPWSLPMPGPSTIIAVLALAVFGTALAYLVFFQILVRAGASNVMLVTLLIPVTAVILGSIFLGEAIQTKEIAGAFVIGLGLLFLDGRLLPRPFRKPQPTPQPPPAASPRP